MPDSEQKMHRAVLTPPQSSQGAEWESSAATHQHGAAVSEDPLSPEPSSSAAEDPSLAVQLAAGASHHATDASAAETASASGNSDSSDGVREELNQSLARLEMNSLQVKLYLDSIEEKISRMEPRLEQIRDRDQLPSTPVLSAAAEDASPASIPAPADASRSPTPETGAPRRRRFDVPQPLSADGRSLPRSAANLLSEEDPWSLKAWLLSRRKQLAIALAILIAFVTILTFGGSVHSRPPTAASVPANTPAPAPLGSVAVSKSPAGTPLLPAAGAVPSASRDGVTPPATEATQPSTSGPVVVQTNPSGATDTVDGVPAVTDYAASANPPEHADDAAPHAGSSASRSIPGRVRVSSGVMAGNLISSRTPKYPGGLASLFHTEGKVTMQAIIARNGRVEDLRVLSGHRLLRGAAQDAVRTWRYRPYVVNGVPVEVATIITVEFHR